LAVSLARSVVFLHASRIVHKNITPENIILLQSKGESLGTPFLVGFERFRFDERRTNMTGDDNWEKNLYRHPQRQGLQPEEVYKMRHDIYSVGVCLLEVGLWSSFVHYTEDNQVAGPDSELPIDSLVGKKNKRKAAAEINAILVEKARSTLPQLMGKIYTDVVVSCLNYLDRDNPLFSSKSDFEDEDGITVGVKYIEKVGILYSPPESHYSLASKS
jgi:serine/threonine protein kinase